MTSETPKPAAAPKAAAKTSETPAPEKAAAVAVEAQNSVSPAPVEPENWYVVSGGDTDPVSLSAIVFKNTAGKKSLSVHHLQRRLTELGFDLAGADKDGYYGDLTRESVAAFQKKHKLDETGLVDSDTLAAVFEGDKYITLHP